MLKDEEADRSIRLARAQGLKVLGQLFCDAAEVAKLKQAGQARYCSGSGSLLSAAGTGPWAPCMAAALLGQLRSTISCFLGFTGCLLPTVTGCRMAVVCMCPALQPCVSHACAAEIGALHMSSVQPRSAGGSERKAADGGCHAARHRQEAAGR